MEFETRRPVYFWPIKQLGLREPIVYEFARLNVKNSLLSKRKIKELITTKVLMGYDDPRLLTISGLRRAGYTPEMLLKFITSIGDPMSKNDSVIDIIVLQNIARDVLNRTAVRCFAIADPMKVKLNNIGEIRVIKKHHPDSKNMLNKESHEVCLTNDIMIDKSDFREKDDKNFYGLSYDKYVRLKYDAYMKCVSYDSKTDIVCADYHQVKDVANPKKIKGCIHWLNVRDSVPAEFWVFDSILDSDGNVNDKSLISYKGFVEKFVDSGKNGDIYYQFERLGYFKYDKGYGVYISTVPLLGNSFGKNKLEKIVKV